MSPRTVPLIIAVALLMENFVASVLATALPEIARDFQTDPIHLKLVLTSYLLALAVFIPASGWVADRFGARTVFRWAILVFALGSVACGLSQGLGQLVAARVLQGIGGSMMMPVGRLILLRAVPRDGVVEALAWLTVPALIGPVIGPPLGGWIATYWDWRWIFWINLPLALLGLVLVTALIPNVRAEEVRRFDALGFLLIGPGLATLLTGITLAGLGLTSAPVILSLSAAGLVLLVLYVAHAGRVAEPILDLSLLRLPAFRIAAIAGTFFRVSSGAMPFLLPLMLQLGFGMTAFAAGMLTFISGVGAMLMKFAAQPLLRHFGFRRVLVGNALIAALVLEGTGILRGTSSTDIGNYPVVFAVITALALASALIFIRLPRGAGADLVRRQGNSRD